MTAGYFVENSKPQDSQIVMWHGNLGNIPSGWALCDGNNGTPNLMDRFVKSVPSTSTTPGTTGGENSKSLSNSQMGAHSHGGGTDSVSSHTHGYNWFDNAYDSGSSSSVGSNGYPASEYGGSHSHNMSVGTSGGDGSYENRPEHFEVAFIMKL